MADICVVYLSEDKAIVRQLVELLREQWNVWWAEDITHGDWEQEVRAAILKSTVLLPVLSGSARTGRNTILKDEMRLAWRHGKPLLPFLIGADELPLGLGDLNYTEALGWAGDPGHDGFQDLRRKVAAALGSAGRTPGQVMRKRELVLGRKTLPLPAFAFSLSSHETQVTPNDGATLLRELEPEAVLVSAYDARKASSERRRAMSPGKVRDLCQSDSVVFLDSGNYEAYRKNDRYSSRGNRRGWRQEQFRETALWLSPDVAFSFDRTKATGSPNGVASSIAGSFRTDDSALRTRDFPLCPIIHLPSEWEGPIAERAAIVVSKVAEDLDPVMLAIPERELGQGLRERAHTVGEIRKALDALGKYYPLHLLGTGNPLSMIALAAAGADAFDGLEWCRTVAEYPTGYLFHFQQFDCVGQPRLYCVKDQKIRRLIENPEVPYRMRALSYNVDFFEDWTRTMRGMIHAGQVEALLKMVPGIGPGLFKDLSA